MKLSIIIPTFNEERTIEEVIQRILETTFPVEYELVVVDDHSSDRAYRIERRRPRQSPSRRTRRPRSQFRRNP